MKSKVLGFWKETLGKIINNILDTLGNVIFYCEDLNNIYEETKERQQFYFQQLVTKQKQWKSLMKKCRDCEVLFMNSREFSNNQISNNNQIYEKKPGVLENFANSQENKILFQWS